jgi:hypothetical protein
VHLELLVEDLSGRKMLEVLIPRLIGEHDTFNIHSYKGIGRIPRGMTDTRNAANRILLENLPKLLKGYGRAFTQYPAAVILVCDLDNRTLTDFLAELNRILSSCDPLPTARFCLAIEEGEAWFLGDIPAIKAAFPSANNEVLNSYINDSICGTWEKLADAIYPGGARALSSGGYQAVGAEKSRWAESITPHMSPDKNLSPSFAHFITTVRSLVA